MVCELRLLCTLRRLDEAIALSWRILSDLEILSRIINRLVSSCASSAHVLTFHAVGLLFLDIVVTYEIIVLDLLKSWSYEARK